MSRIWFLDFGGPRPDSEALNQRLDTILSETHNQPSEPAGVQPGEPAAVQPGEPTGFSAAGGSRAA